MKNFKNVLLVSLILITMFPVSASAKELISLLPALLNDHEQVRAAEAKRDEARYRYLSRRGDWLPDLDLSADAGREWVNKVDSTRSSETRNYASLKLTQLVSDFGKTKSSIDSAKAIFDRSVIELEATRQEILAKAISAYLEVVKAREKLGYATKSEKNIKDQTGMEETLVKRGAGVTTDILQTKAQLARARALRVSVMGDLFLAKNRFKAVFGDFPDEDTVNSLATPKGPMDKMPPTLEEAIAKALENNPKILAEQLNVLAAGHELEFSKSKFKPQIKLFAEGVRRERDQAVIGVREEGIVGAEMSYNLLNGGSDRSSVKAAAANHEEIKNVLAENMKIVEEQVRNAWQNLKTTKEKHKFLTTQTSLLGEFLKLAKKERKLGTRSLLDVLNGEVEYINAVSQSVATEIDTIMAAYNLFYAMGDLTMDTM